MNIKNLFRKNKAKSSSIVVNNNYKRSKELLDFIKVALDGYEEFIDKLVINKLTGKIHFICQNTIYPDHVLKQAKDLPNFWKPEYLEEVLKIERLTYFRALVGMAILLYGKNANLNFIETKGIKDFSSLFTGDRHIVVDNKALSKIHKDWRCDEQEKKVLAYNVYSSAIKVRLPVYLFNGWINKWSFEDALNCSHMFKESCFNRHPIYFNFDGGYYYDLTPKALAWKSTGNHNLINNNFSNHKRTSNDSFVIKSKSINFLKEKDDGIEVDCVGMFEKSDYNHVVYIKGKIGSAQNMFLDAKIQKPIHLLNLTKCNHITRGFYSPSIKGSQISTCDLGSMFDYLYTEKLRYDDLVDVSENCRFFIHLNELNGLSENKLKELFGKIHENDFYPMLFISNKSNFTSQTDVEILLFELGCFSLSVAQNCLSKEQILAIVDEIVKSLFLYKENLDEGKVLKVALEEFVEKAIVENKNIDLDNSLNNNSNINVNNDVNSIIESNNDDKNLSTQEFTKYEKAMIERIGENPLTHFKLALLYLLNLPIFEQKQVKVVLLEKLSDLLCEFGIVGMELGDCGNNNGSGNHNDGDNNNNNNIVDDYNDANENEYGLNQRQVNGIRLQI